jgi:hypothetical protein
MRGSVVCPRDQIDRYSCERPGVCSQRPLEKVAIPPGNVLPTMRYLINTVIMSLKTDKLREVAESDAR